jgi:hypothetical protein
MYPAEPAGSKFPRRERALGGNPQARTPTNNATSRLGGRAPKRRSPWGMLKVKVASRGFSTPRPLGSIVFLPQQVSAFISRGATHHTDV